VPPAERIATFDKDGTLRGRAADILAAALRARPGAQHREWKTKEPFASPLRSEVGKALAGGYKALPEIDWKPVFASSDAPAPRGDQRDYHGGSK
jgi:hypothetical protein